MVEAAIAAASLAVLAAAPRAGGPRAIEAALASAGEGGPRAAAATRPLVGVRYLRSPLGEGFGPDPDPRFRLDAFDCMTLVETAVALGSASTLDEARLAMDDVRYAGVPGFGTRNHEVISQWIPRNLAKGWIADVGREVGGPLARTVEKEYTPESWDAVRASGRAIRGLTRSSLPLGRFSVDIVPAADVASVAARIPEGTIAFVVRSDSPGRLTRVSHAGLVVLGDGGARLVRHASSSKGIGRVIDEPLERFVRRERAAHPLWPLDGIALFAIRPNAGRVRALASAPRPAAARQGERPPALPPSPL